MFQNRNVTLRIAIAVIISAGLAACSEKSRSPLSPYVAGPMEGVSIGAPSPVGPLDGTLVAVGDPLILRFGSATSNSERPFWYEIQLAADSQFLDVRHEADQVDPVDEGLGGLAEGGTHDYTVPDPLDSGQTYWWRTRAVDGANIGAYSNAQAFEIFTPVVLGVPEPTSPPDGATLADLTPFLKATMPSVSGPAENLRLQFEVATDPGFSNRVAFLSATPDGTQASLTLTGSFSSSTTYYWRVRAAAKGREGEVVGQWSASRRFTTPAPAPAPPPPSGGGGGGGGGGYTAGGSPNAPFTTNGGSPPNMFHVVQQVAAQHPGALQNSRQSHGGSWEFMDRVVEALRAIDGRWAYNCKRGNCGDISHDVVDYYRGSGNPHSSTDVAIIDIIGGHCGGSPQPAWFDVTQATQQAGSIGRWKYPR